MKLGRLTLVGWAAVASLFLQAQPAGGNVSGGARHAAAVRAAFPHGLRVRRGEETTHFRRSILVEAPFGPVLVAGGEVSQTLDGLPGAASHGTEGRVAAFYLRANGAAFTVLRAFPNAARNGSFGELGDWSITRQFTAHPAIYTQGGGTWQGVTCTIATLSELRSDGPFEIAVIPIHFENGGVAAPGEMRAVSGRISNVRRSRSFDVVFSGSEQFTDHYVYRNGRFRRTTERSRAQC